MTNDRCPECEAPTITQSAGPLPVCTTCGWTGWDPEDEARQRPEPHRW